MSRNYLKKGGHGGRRAGAGRKPASNGVAERYRERYPMLPLDYLLCIAGTGVDPVTGKKATARRMERAAIAAMPYVHRRLAPVAAEELKPQPKFGLDLSKLSDDELVVLERIYAKSQIPIPPDEDEVSY